MKTARVRVLPYDRAWKSDFEAIKKELERAVGSLAVGIEHVGSTAVEGMSAKPCIDIDMIIRDYSVFEAVVRKLEGIGYLHEGNLGIPGREAFRYSGKAHLQTHHLYVCPLDSEELHRHIRFRDFLRASEEAVREYSRVKERAAQLFPEDIDGYMEYKAPCIAALYARCGLNAADTKTGEHTMKILVTGFEPFNGGAVNPSEQIVYRLTAPAGVSLVKEILPVEFRRSKARLQELFREHRPDIVLSIGQAGGRPEISVERVAINVDSVKSSDGSRLLPDNAGETPVDEAIEADGAAAYFATLPLWQMVEAIQEKGIPAGISNSAGTYVCNHVMYVNLHQAAVQYPQMKAGFIHVPFLPEQIEQREDRARLAAMPLETMVTALQAVLEALAK